MFVLRKDINGVLYDTKTNYYEDEARLSKYLYLDTIRLCTTMKHTVLFQDYTIMFCPTIFRSNNLLECFCALLLLDELRFWHLDCYIFNLLM